MPREPVRLNADELRCILAYLWGTDALNFSLACKSFYELAIGRVVAVVQCENHSKLLSLRTDMLYFSRPRAQCIESLTIQHSALGPDRFERGDPGTRAPRATLGSHEDQTRPDWTLRVTETMRWQAEIIADILTYASNIRHLRLPLVARMMKNGSNMEKAISALPMLTSATFDLYENPDLSFLAHLPPIRLRTLRLCFDRYPENIERYQLLCTSVVAAIPTLRTLVLERFQQHAPPLEPPIPECSVRTLMLTSGWRIYPSLRRRDSSLSPEGVVTLRFSRG